MYLIIYDMMLRILLYKHQILIKPFFACTLNFTKYSVTIDYSPVRKLKMVVEIINFYTLVFIIFISKHCNVIFDVCT